MSTSVSIETVVRGVAEFLIVAGLYFALAKFGLSLAFIHPSASPIWPPTGFALAVTLLRGFRAAPAIFAGAMIANALTAGNAYTSIAIATGNTLEAVIGAALIMRWAGGTAAFSTATGVAKFVLVELIATPVSAAVGVTSLAAWGFVPWDSMAEVSRTWWLGDLAGAVVIAPVIVLWGRDYPRKLQREDLLEAAAIFVMAAVVGIIGFAPVGDWATTRGTASFLVILPLMWAALRRGQRDTATVAGILSGFAVWGTLSDSGPFSGLPINDALFRLLIFMISTAVPSLALSADVAARKRTEGELRAIRGRLEERVHERTAALRQEMEQRQQAERERERQRIQLLEAQRLANLGSWVWDVRTNRVTWSGQLYTIYGIQPEEFDGTLDAFVSRLHPDDREHVQYLVADALKRGQGFQTRERILRPNGEVRHLETCGELIRDEDGNVTQMLGICQDVTEAREAERKLERTETTYRHIVEGIRDHAIFMLDPRGHIMSWNPAAARLKGHEAHEILGKHMDVFHTEEDRRSGLPRQALETAMREGKFECEGLRVRKDGSTFWANVATSAIRDAKGKLIGFVQITRDVTQKREADKKLEETREQLFQAQKMEAVGQLTGGIAHDFNNLLTAILGSSSIIERVSGENAQLLRNARNIRYAAERGANLTRQLLSFARRQPLRPEILDLRQKLPITAELLAHSLRGDIKVSTHIDADTYPVKIDTGEFDLALLNIAVNSQDAMPEGGTLTIRVHNCVLDGEPAGLKGEFVSISIADTGVGIPAELQAKIFEPFFTTKDTGKGSGLGLSQVYGFVQQSGGGVGVESHEGEGTTVTLFLPAAEGHQAVPAEFHEMNSERAERATVLLVEDDPDVARTTRETLLQYGYRVHSAANAASALEMLEKEDRIDVVFSDVVMPGGMNGVELARAVRSLRPELPILLTSGFSDVVTHEAAQEFILLRKPYQPQDLKQHIDMLLRTR
ncbi:MAG: MASE1 domain-containing protein [Alphaproteobacteria bacterium]